MKLYIIYSTGIRVGKLINLNIKNMNFAERSCIALGKGNKQREVYFDAKTKLYIKQNSIFLQNSFIDYLISR